MTQPRVLLDVDGIVASFCGAAAKVMTDLAGRHITHDDITNWDVAEILESHELRMAAREAFNQEGFCQSFDIYDGAQDAVNQLVHMSEFYFVTAPMKNNRTWMPERVEWLLKHFNVGFKQICFVCDKFIVQGDFLVEDHPGNAIQWQKENPHGKALLWDRAYNRSEGEDLQRVSSWQQVLDEVRAWTPERRLVVDGPGKATR